MEFKYFDFLQLKYGLGPLNLECLKKDTNPYSTLLCQCKGKLKFSNNFFGNSAPILAKRKFLSFFKTARERRSALVITPEYSCPWTVIEHLANNPSELPADNKIWAIGCESISKEKIVTIKKMFHKKNNLIFHFDESILGSDKSFLDPLCYIFKVLFNPSGKAAQGSKNSE